MEQSIRVQSIKFMFLYNYENLKRITQTENGKKLQINGATLIDLADYSEINVISFDIDKSVNDSTGKILKITLTSITQNTYTFTVTSRTGSTFTKAQ